MSEKKTSTNANSAEIIKLFPVWRHEGLTPLTAIVSYTTLLLDSQVENLTEQQKQFITTIRNAALKAYSSWKDPGAYIKLTFDSDNINWNWESVQLSEICETILSSSFKFINKSNVHVNVSEKLPPVRADRGWLSIAIANLLEPSVGYFYNADLEWSISAQEQADNTILLRVVSGLQLSTDEKFDSIESISFPGSSLSVVGIILDRHGSRLEFRRLKSDNDAYRSRGTEFEFVLPVWR